MHSPRFSLTHPRSYNKESGPHVCARNFYVQICMCNIVYAMYVLCSDLLYENTAGQKDKKRKLNANDLTRV